MKKTIFTGSGVAIVTPMHEDGSVNYDVLERLIEFHIANGTDAIIACGTTGESPTLNHQEHTEVLRFTINKAAGRLPVIAGSGSNDTAYALELSLEAQRMGADALLMVTPYYNKTSQVGLIRHFTYIADRVQVPIILYNVPSRTGCNIKPETYLELSKHPNIAAVKEANGDISSVAQTIALCGDALDVYSGNDDQIVPFMSVGGKGVISVFANVLPQEMHNICADCLKGDYARASSSFLHYLELMQAFFMDVNPIPIKEAMNQMGYQAGPCRLPLTEMSAAAKDKLAAVLRKYKLL
ncbi:4-hydroxy-tetrahydrodipicolinate synthase [Hydrogeniiclostridium mannosilyticum]|uniref:4-hydroxy-tetrahydrodipicolinate synthase n=1 Tax=Hydrogeniiclostridium mannosilyticum TaxID=2764322 RepID=UPI00399A2880